MSLKRRHLNKLIKKNSFEIELDIELMRILKFDSSKYINQISLKNLDEFCLFILNNYK